MRILTSIFLVYSCLSIHAQVEETKFKLPDPFELKHLYGINPFHLENSVISDSTVIKDLESQLKNNYFIKEEKIKQSFENKLDLDNIISKDSIIQIQDTNSILDHLKWENEWKLVAFQEFSYRQQGKAIPITKKDASYYDVNKTPKTYSTSELFEFCSISAAKYKIAYPLTYVPEISEQNQSYNFHWTISYLPCKIEKCKELGTYTASIPNEIFCEKNHSEYLLVRRVYIYPNGDATSWYEEKVFFFKKVK